MAESHHGRATLAAGGGRVGAELRILSGGKLRRNHPYPGVTAGSSRSAADLRIPTTRPCNPRLQYRWTLTDSRQRRRLSFVYLLPIGLTPIILEFPTIMTARKPRFESFQSLFHELNDGGGGEAETGRLVEVNRKASEVLGYTEDELLNMRVWDVQEIFSDESIWRVFRKQIRKKGWRVVEGAHKRKDGSSFPVETNIREFSGSGRGPLRGGGPRHHLAKASRGETPKK